MFKYVVVDDEKPARDEIKFLLNDFEDFEFVGEADNGIECLNLLKEKDIDVVFLDIDMPKVNGIIIASKIFNFEKPPRVIFVTAYNEYAINAFEVNALDYLLKPISMSRLKATIDKIRNLDSNKRFKINLKDYKELKNINTRICLEQSGVYIPVELMEIIYAKVEGKHTYLITKDAILEYSGNLSQLEEKLLGNNFFRSHRSYILNIDYIEIIEPWFNNTYMVKLKYIDEKVPVSRSQIKKFKDLVGI